jgi:hypothetical protein
LADLKNRTRIGSHQTASKNQQIQAPLTAYVRSSEFTRPKILHILRASGGS